MGVNVYTSSVYYVASFIRDHIENKSLCNGVDVVSSIALSQEMVSVRLPLSVAAEYAEQ